MSNVNKSWVRALCILLLMIVMIFIARQSNAAIPKAGIPIGTRATITYRDASNVLQKRESDIVLTRIDQVYQVDVVAMRKPAHAEKGENADIPFQVTNVGNGIDDVTLNVNTFPKNIDNVIFFNADAGGVPQAGTGVKSSTSNPVPFTLKGIDTNDDRRYFVLRMPLPKSAKKNEEFNAELGVKTKGGASKSVIANAMTIDGNPFSVVPVGTAKLNGEKKAWVQFRVNGGVTSKRGYFELWAVKGADVSTPLTYQVGKRASFDGHTLRHDEFDSNDDKLFKIVHEVGGNGSYLIKMPITVADAERGDEIVMFAKYGEADPTGIKPIIGEAGLEKSTGFVIRFDHIEVSPVLEVVNNSRPVPGVDFTRIEQAVPGETVDYDLVLHNKSTFADTFLIEELTEGKGELIAAVKPMDSTGQEAISIGVHGLPETEAIPANGDLKFKISVRLRDGRTSKRAQNVQFRIKSVGARTVDPIAQVLTIDKVISGGNPSVTFSDTDDMSGSTNKFTLTDGQDTKQFYMRIKNPENADKLPHVYQMRFVKKGFTIKSYSEPSCGSVVTHTGPVGDDGQIFCVDADLSGISLLESELIVTDPVRATQATATITLVKSADIAFESTAYDGNGEPGGDAALTIRIVNRGGDMTSKEYQLWHDATDTTSATKLWSTIFSFDEKNWESSLLLPEMKSGSSKDVFVKIAIPEGVVVNRTWSVTLGLRESGDKKKSKATAVVTLALDENGLIVIKEIAIVKSVSSTSPADCTVSVSPGNFSKTTKVKVQDGDCIWYRVSVTNPSMTATVSDVTITDPIPKYSAYVDGAKTNLPEAIPNFHEGKIVTKGIDLVPGNSLELIYPVTVNFKK
jgi:uncharacterized repeat protein (TIGR01451 family)